MFSRDLIWTCLQKMGQPLDTITSPFEKAAILMTAFDSFSKRETRSLYNAAVLDFAECPETLMLLKQLLGSRLHIIYVETDEAIRAHRARRSPWRDDLEAQEKRRNFVLRAWGRDRRNEDGPPMRQLADLVLNNNGSLAGTLNTLQDQLKLSPLTPTN